MINLTFTVDNISTVLTVFDTIQIRRYIGTGIPPIPVDILDYTTLSGSDSINNRTGVSDILLDSRYNQYYFVDPDGTAESWYVSRYFNSSNSSSSAWTDPVLGEPGDIYYDPSYPVEVEYGSADQLIIDRIRLLIGDPIGLNREYGDHAESSIHFDGRTYELDEKGWPAYVNMNGVQFTETTNPSINGYKYLRFTDFIDVPTTVISGGRTIQQGVDIWYYTFRWSDREIMEAYNTTPPPTPLNTSNCTAEIYMLQCAYDLLSSETWEDLTEDGARIQDEGSKYDPEPGLKNREAMLKRLKDRLDAAIKAVTLVGITGVLID